MTDAVSTVAHCVRVWLPRTQTWLYAEVTNLGPRWRSRVVANRREHVAEFPYDDVYALRERAGAGRWFLETALVSSGLLKVPPSMARELERIAAHVVHSHFGYVGWRNAELVQKLRAKHVVSFYGFDLTQLPREERWRQRYADMFHRVDCVLCEGPHMRGTVLSLGCDPDKVRVYPLGVSLDRIRYRPPVEPRERPLAILMAASFRQKKGLPDGIAAIGRLRAAIPGLRVRLSIVGSGGDSAVGRAEDAAIRTAVTAAGVKDVTEFLGSRPHAELLAIARDHDLFVSPSRVADDGDSEGGAPVGLIEMAALGLPIVSTQHCDIPFVLGAPNRELLVPERDVQALADALTWLVQNPQRWPALAEANRLHIERHLDIARQGPVLAGIYEDVLRGR